MAAATDEHSEAEYKKLAEEIKGAIEHNFEREQTINRILGQHTSEERQKICCAYSKLAYKKLESNFQGWFTSNYAKLVVILCRSAADRDAYRAREALKGLGTDECCLAILLITKTPEEISNLKDSYKKLFGSLLEDDIIGDTSGDFKQFLILLLRKSPQDGVDDENSYVSMANQLYAAGESQSGTDEYKLSKILINTKPEYLRKVFKFYMEIADKEIEESVGSETSGDYKQGLMKLLTYIRHQENFYAMELSRCLNSWFVKHREIRNIIVERSEVDMDTIKKRYEELYERSLEDALYSRTTGPYRDLLITLINRDLKKETNNDS